ncbi:hypothetical protein PV408_27725, partial [Streptomyces sp. ME18-1-4]|nr:hypothetical protein [Streptomyces sp. ME18-1-4]
MTLLVGAAAVQKSGRENAETYSLRMCSAIPGRQRWKIAEMAGRTRFAKVLESVLEKSPGVRTAKVSGVTGSVLVLHDPRLETIEVGRIIRDSLATVFRAAQRRPATPLSQNAPSTAPASA